MSRQVFQGYQVQRREKYGQLQLLWHVSPYVLAAVLAPLIVAAIAALWATAFILCIRWMTS